ncbi:MAG: gliding motility lipoprotein GldB [Bacteroidia bacterium]
MKQFNFFDFLLIVFLMTVFTSCHNNKLKDVDISNIQITPVKFLRMDKDVFLTKLDSFKQESQKMKLKYGTFYNSFIFDVINHGEEHDSVYKALSLFVQDADMKEVFNQSGKVFTDEIMLTIENQLSDGLKRLKYHLPQTVLPKRYVSFISGFNYNITTMDSTLGIGLDMYLGSENNYYQMLKYPKYKSRCMNTNYVVSDALKGWLIHCYDKNEQLNNLLNHMIFYGKLYYALDAAIPDVEDSVKIQYTSAQMQYCKNFQKNLWAYCTQQNRLYNNDLKELAPLISDGPFTAVISKECPPRIAMYIGWQVVRAFMNKNTDVSVEKLMSTDAQIILSKSKYKP